MDMEFLVKGKVLLFMNDYIEEYITLFDKDLYATLSSPEKKGFKNHKWKFTQAGQAISIHYTLYSCQATVCDKTGEDWYWTRNIVPVHQGDQEHCGEQSETEAYAEITETDNQW